jgi:hypothetical protein
MPATNFPEYARGIQDVLDTAVAAGEAVLVSIQVDQRSSLGPQGSQRQTRRRYAAPAVSTTR